MDFEKIAPYLKDPLVLIGFVLFLGFLFIRGIIKAGIIPVLARTSGYRILQRILLYGFIISLALIGLGFGLKYRDLSKQEQASVVHLLEQELADNYQVLGELKNNTETILGAASSLAQVLRTPGIRLMAALFPASNAGSAQGLPAPSEYAEQLLRQANTEGLIGDREERRKFGLAATAITGTILRTTSVIKSLADIDGKHYVLKSEAWNSQLPILRKVHLIDVTKYQAAYTELELARANYNVVIERCIDYLAAVDLFLNPPDRQINPQRLGSALATERLFVSVSTAYSTKLIEDITRTKALREELARQSVQL